MTRSISVLLFFFNDRAPPEISPLSLHDALPISAALLAAGAARPASADEAPDRWEAGGDRKSTRLNSSHGYISDAVFCLQKQRYGVPSPGGRQRSGEGLWPKPGVVWA